MNNKRSLKTNIKNTNLINPINLNIISNPNNLICVNKLNYNNNNFNYYNNNSICNNNDDFIKKYMYIPPITISPETILNIYNMNDINDIIDYVDINLKNKNFFQINRLLKCWIRINLHNLQLYLNIIENIYLKILYVYLNINTNLDLDFEKIIKDYIKYWIKKNNDNTVFKLDLFIDIIEYYKKYIKNN